MPSLVLLCLFHLFKVNMSKSQMLRLSWCVLLRRPVAISVDRLTISNYIVAALAVIDDRL